MRTCFQGPLPFGNCSALKGFLMSGFQHLCVSSSLFEDYDHLPQASRMKNQGPRTHSGAVDISGPNAEAPQAGGLLSFLYFV